MNKDFKTTKSLFDKYSALSLSKRFLYFGIAAVLFSVPLGCIVSPAACEERQPVTIEEIAESRFKSPEQRERHSIGANATPSNMEKEPETEPETEETLPEEPETTTEAETEAEETPEIKKENFVWNESEEPGQISGLTIAGSPAELFMLSIAGETSGGSTRAITTGDKGRAYGLCQFDYRYDLVGFMNYAYKRNPGLWAGFAPYLGYGSGNTVLRGNSDIGNTFIHAMQTDYETAVSEQLAFVKMKYWNDFSASMNRAGFRLNERHVAVSAALLSVNVNCGPQAGVFINNLNPDSSDAEMICKIYEIRNTILANQYVGSVKKGTTHRYRVSEPQMALDLLHGYTTIDSKKNYGGGVEWKGNIFSERTTTIALSGASYEWTNYSYDYDDSLDREIDPVNDEQYEYEIVFDERISDYIDTEFEEYDSDYPWVRDGNGWKCLDANDEFVVGDFYTVNGSTYYFNDEGYMLTGWQQIGGKWYMFRKDGAMYRNITIEEGYYFDKDGVWDETTGPDNESPDENDAVLESSDMIDDSDIVSDDIQETESSFEPETQAQNEETKEEESFDNQEIQTEPETIAEPTENISVSDEESLSETDLLEAY